VQICCAVANCLHTLSPLLRLQDGKVLGCQAVGEEGVEKRVDVVAAFMQKGGTVFDLEEAELCYGEAHALNSLLAVCSSSILDVLR
jgi:hypothetical protein